jgi:23S rRNA pseudouridine1911/1915/1917 synthase
VAVDGSIPSGRTLENYKELEADAQGVSFTEKGGVMTSCAPTLNMNIPTILKETDEYLVLSKPAGFLVHPTQAQEKDTLAAWLLHTYPSIASVGDSPERPGLVHRLDKAASGVLVVAKTQQMFDHLKSQFQARTVGKKYTVLVYGQVPADHGMIDFPIDRGKDGRMVSRPRRSDDSLKGLQNRQAGKDALTEFWMEKRSLHYSLLDVQIHTGRMHQIRVHLYAYGYPVVGDSLYMNRKIVREEATKLGRLFLHARELTFTDLSGNQVRVDAPLPTELEAFTSDI